MPDFTPPVEDIRLYRGNLFTIQVPVVDSDGVPISLAAASGTLYLYATADADPNSGATRQITGTPGVLDGQSVFDFPLTSAISGLPAKVYYYDVFVSLPGGVEKTVQRGRFEIVTSASEEIVDTSDPAMYRRCKEAIADLLEGRAQSVEIDGETYGYHNLDSLQRQLKYFSDRIELQKRSGSRRAVWRG